jgi:hypothetical protein
MSYGLRFGGNAKAQTGFPEKGSATGKSRLEAFSDGVLAIILTIMVLEMMSWYSNRAAVPDPATLRLFTK